MPLSDARYASILRQPSQQQVSFPNSILGELQLKGIVIHFVELHHTHIPRTSLDLELDLQAQHSKLFFLNDQISKLQNLKEV